VGVFGENEEHGRPRIRSVVYLVLYSFMGRIATKDRVARRRWPCSHRPRPFCAAGSPTPADQPPALRRPSGGARL
jgi:hypothetical protein